MESLSIETCSDTPGSAFIKPDQLDPWIKDQLGNALLSTILPPQLWNFVSCGRACPSHMTQNLVTVACRGEIVDRRMIFIWSLIHGSGWSGLIKVEPVWEYAVQPAVRTVTIVFCSQIFSTEHPPSQFGEIIFSLHYAACQSDMLVC